MSIWKTEINQPKFFQKTWFFVLLSGLLGLIFCFTLYSELINPFETEWLFEGGADPAAHQLGWEMFRNSDWTFPFGVAKDYGYPVGASIVYTDSIPLLAIFFKLFNLWLPVNFQYIGLWILLSFILQGIFGFLLLKTFVKNNWIALLGSVIFLFSPILHLRVHGHTALASHWLILWALWLVIREHTKLRVWLWSAVLLLSTLIHPYLLFMVGILMLADVFWLGLQKKSINFKVAVLFLFLQLVLVLLFATALGIFVNKLATGHPEFGLYTMDLTAPTNSAGWSKLLPSTTFDSLKMEGFNYLGLGVIVMLFVSGLTFLFNRLKEKIVVNWFLVSAIVFFMMLAVTNKIVILGKEFIYVPMPDFIENDFFGILRASGRFFWPVYYLIVVASFYYFKQAQKKWLAIGVMIAMVFVQFYDLSGKFYDLDKSFENRSLDYPITAEIWKTNPVGYEHIVFLPKAAQAYETAVRFAYKYQLTVNDGYFARPLAGEALRFGIYTAELKTGTVRDDTVYVFSYHDPENYLRDWDFNKHLLAKVDDLVLLLPNFVEHYPGLTPEDLGLQKITLK